MVLHFLEFASAVVLKHVRRTANMVAQLLASVAGFNKAGFNEGGFNEMPRKPPKSSLIGKKKKKMELDRISNLPTGVSHQILSYLSIKEAVRTSVLSSNWRYKWTKLPCLVFDDKHGCMTKRVLDHVLLLHRGRIEIFELSIRSYPGNSYITYGDIDKWIAHLSRHSIKEFILKLWKHWSAYNIFSRLFSYQDLTHLELHNCLLEVPLTFKGFEMLKSLHLRKVTVSQDGLEKLIVCCPRLNRMILCGLKGITHVNITSPSIQFLKVRGSFENVQLKNTFNLVDVSIHRTKSSRSSRTLLRHLFKLPRLERLTLEDRFLQCGSLPEKLSPCLCLNFLSISIRVNNLKEIFTAICLLRRSPALQELEISIRQEDEANAAGAPYCLHENQKWEFTQLRRVKLTSFSGVKAEVDMIKFLLLSSSALQELEISFDQEDAKEVNFSGLDDNQNCAIKQLQLVKVTGVSGVKAEVDFIRYLISSSSPMLIERMILQPASAVVYWELFKLLPEFRRDSVHVDLKVLDLDPSSSPLQDSDDHGSFSDSDDSFSDSDDDMFY